MKERPDINDTLRAEGPHAVRARFDRAPKFDGSTRQWSDPHPLPHSLLPIGAFDFGLVPDQVCPWVADVCERMQCPPDYIAVSLMAALGSMIGRKVAIRPQLQDDWNVIANQWALLIGRPGVLKSPAMEEALRPLRKLSAMAEEELKKETAAYEVMASAAKLRREENVKQAAKILRKDRKADVSSLLEAEGQTSAPTLRRYIANDTNVASLGVLLQQNPNGLLVFRDEIVSLLDNLDREEFVSERGFYLTGWAGDSRYTFDRIGRGLHLSVDGVCLSMLGSTQPGRISQYLSRAIRGGRGDDGLIQRFGLMIWPDVSPEWKHVDRWPNREAKTAAMKIFERLDALDWRAIEAKRDRGPDGDEEGLPYLRFGIDAYDLFMGWRTALEQRLRSGE
jgi:putative DNA primase/helicase